MNEFVVRIARKGRTVKFKIVDQPEKWREKFDKTIFGFRLKSSVEPCFMLDQPGMWLRGRGEDKDARTCGRKFLTKCEAKAWVKAAKHAITAVGGKVLPLNPSLVVALRRDGRRVTAQVLVQEKVSRSGQPSLTIGTDGGFEVWSGGFPEVCETTLCVRGVDESRDLDIASRVFPTCDLAVEWVAAITRIIENAGGEVVPLAPQKPVITAEEWEHIRFCLEGAEYIAAEFSGNVYAHCIEPEIAHSLNSWSADGAIYVRVDALKERFAGIPWNESLVKREADD